MSKRERLILARRRKIKNFFLVMLVLVLIVGGWWLLFLSPYLDIDKIVIVPNDLGYFKDGVDSYFKNKFEQWIPLGKISNSNYLSSLISLALSQVNYRRLILFSSSQLQADLLKNYPVIKNLSFKINIRDGILQIFPVLRTAKYVYCEKEPPCYLVDQEGVVFEVADNTYAIYDTATELNSLLKKDKPEEKTIKVSDLEEGLFNEDIILSTGTVNGLPEINLETKIDIASLRKITASFSNTPQLGKSLLPKDLITELDAIYELTVATTSPFQVSEVELAFPVAARKGLLNIKTDNGFIIKVDSSQNFRDIYEVINLLKEEKLGERINNLEYLDCRFLPKLYYRFK